MKKWYLVKKNWEVDDFSKFGMEYLGVGGDNLPYLLIDNFVARLSFSTQMDRSKSYTELKYNDNVTYVYAFTELSVVEKYFYDLKIYVENIILVEIKPAFEDFDPNVDGFDFGNPEGGYSIIEAELIYKYPEEIIRYYLNEYGLFKNVDLMYNFVSSLEDAVQQGTCEELDDYMPVAIKKLAPTK